MKKVAKILNSEGDCVGRSNLQLKLHVVREVKCRILRQRETMLKWFDITFIRLKAVADDIIASAAKCNHNTQRETEDYGFYKRIFLPYTMTIHKNQGYLFSEQDP